MTTLLNRLGGEVAVTAVVNSFYDKVFADPLLMPFFVETDLAKQRQRQTKFLIQFMDGKAGSAAEYMRTAHRRAVAEMGLNDTHFNTVAGHLVATLKEFGVSEALIAEVGGALETLRGPVLNIASPADN